MNLTSTIAARLGRSAATAAVGLCCALLLAACDDGSRQAKPEATGRPWELVVQVDRSAWQGELGDTLRAVLEGSTPLLPQHEPMFRLSVIHQPLSQYKLFRSRLLIELDSKTSEPQLAKAVDLVARPQMEVKVTAPDAAAAAHFIGHNRQLITDLFVDHELHTEAARLRRRYSRMVADSVSHQFGHTVCVPEDMRASKTAQDFFWAGTNLLDKDLNYVLFAYDWDRRPLELEAFVAKRDSVMRTNIPGSRADQWMETSRLNDSTAAPLAIARVRIYNKVMVLEVHGLWDMRGGALGGPFVAQARIDSAQGRVLVNEGFIYSPHSPKRALLRQMQAALTTFE